MRATPSLRDTRLWAKSKPSGTTGNCAQQTAGADVKRTLRIAAVDVAVEPKARLRGIDWWRTGVRAKALNLLQSGFGEALDASSGAL
jgi:hypothetical protein